MGWSFVSNCCGNIKEGQSSLGRGRPFGNFDGFCISGAFHASAVKQGGCPAQHCRYSLFLDASGRHVMSLEDPVGDDSGSLVRRLH